MKTKNARVSPGRRWRAAAWTSLAVSVSLAASEPPAVGTVVYWQSFEAGGHGAEWFGAGSVQSTCGLSEYGFGAWHLRNDGPEATGLRLTGLAPHSRMTLTFGLAIWDSVDVHQSDRFQVQVDGGRLIDEVFGNYFPPSGSAGPGVQITPPTTGEYTNPELGFSTAFRDSARSVSSTFNHAVADLGIAFQFPASQGGYDESFGIDNVIVMTDAGRNDLPALSIATASSSVIIQWPVWATGFVLESTPALPPGAWTELGGRALPVGRFFLQVVPMEADLRFFRLRK